jgi:catechol 2,3-dioxygenase-like lactoylglutathione lyase family enzyme
VLLYLKIEHIAISSKSVEDSDKFFIELLGMKKERDFVVPDDLIEQFFGVRKNQRILRYENDELSVEAFIMNDDSIALDTFTHTCLLIEDREKLIKKARQLNFKVIRVPRKNNTGFYLFLKDNFGNLFEIK